MIKYILYELSTGVIIEDGQTQSLVNKERTGYGVIESEASARDNYVDITTMAIVPLTTMTLSINKTSIVADTVDKVIITNIPIETTYSIDYGEPSVINDGLFEFSTDIPRKYTLELFKVEYYREVIEIDAT